MKPSRSSLDCSVLNNAHLLHNQAPVCAIRNLGELRHPHGSDCWVRYGSNNSGQNGGTNDDKGKDCNYLGSGDYSPEKTTLSQCLAHQPSDGAGMLGHQGSRTLSLRWSQRLPAPLKRPRRPEPLPAPNLRGSGICEISTHRGMQASCPLFPTLH
jgi:hypothetical protein